MSDKKPAFFGALPNRNQLAWQEMGMYAFLHFTVNTFTGREWGDGTEPEDIFQPDRLDCEQWCRFLKEQGFGGAILTAKHHDGFCLWPSKYTEHSVKNSSWRGGKGDVVGDFVRAARKYGLKIGFYLSPWDRHEKTYGTGEPYNEYYRNQLAELLTVYGGEDVFMTWFDGACGEGANGKVQVYDFEKPTELIHRLAPNAVIMGHMGDHRDIRWCGNEEGFAGNPNRPTIHQYRLEALQNGDRNGVHYWPSEVDVSIRPGWFHHEHENNKIRSLEKMLDIWYRSVGNGSCLNLNFPPDRHGQIPEPDMERMRELKRILDATFSENFAQNAPVAASGELGPEFSAAHLTDGNPETLWAAPEGELTPSLVVELGKIKRINRVELREDTRFGVRVEGFELEYRSACGEWKNLAKDTNISFRKIVRTKTVETDALRLKITDSMAAPCLRFFGVYYQPPVLFALHCKRDAHGNVTLSCSTTEAEIYYTTDGTEPTEQSAVYHAPFLLETPGTVRAFSKLSPLMEKQFPEFAKTDTRVDFPFGELMNEWKILAADSELDDSNKADNLLSGDDGKLWISSNTPYPHRIAVDTARHRTVHGFRFHPAWQGHIARYRFLLAENPEFKHAFVLEGTFDNMANNPIPRTVTFEHPVEGRFFAFEALESACGLNYASIGKIELF